MNCRPPAALHLPLTRRSGRCQPKEPAGSATEAPGYWAAGRHGPTLGDAASAGDALEYVVIAAGVTADELDPPLDAMKELFCVRTVPEHDPPAPV